MAGAPGLEPGPSVLETDMLAIDTMPLFFQQNGSNARKTEKIVFDFVRTPGTVIISLLCGGYASGKIDNIFSLPDDPDHFSYFSSWNSSVAYTHHRLMK